MPCLDNQNHTKLNNCSLIYEQINDLNVIRIWSRLGRGPVESHPVRFLVITQQNAKNTSSTPVERPRPRTEAEATTNRATALSEWINQFIMSHVSTPPSNPPPNQSSRTRDWPLTGGATVRSLEKQSSALAGWGSLHSVGSPGKQNQTVQQQSGEGLRKPQASSQIVHQPQPLHRWLSSTSSFSSLKLKLNKKAVR